MGKKGSEGRQDTKRKKGCCGSESTAERKRKDGPGG